MQTIPMSDVVHFNRRVVGKYVDGEMIITRANEIPCKPDSDKVLRTGESFDTVNCPDCIAIMTAD